MTLRDFLVSKATARYRFLSAEANLAERDKNLEAAQRWSEHYQLENLVLRREIGRMQKAIARKNRAIKRLREQVKQHA